MKCKSCGNEFDIGIFCPNCGFKNEEETVVLSNDIQESAKVVANNKDANKVNMDATTNPQGKGRGLAIASLVMGVISVLTIGAFIIPEILGIVFALVSKKDSEMSGLAKAGMICSIISIIIFVVIILFM